MRLNVLFFTLSFLFTLTTSAQYVTLTGHITDEVTTNPVENANVFIANTLMGNASDRSGFFRITGVPYGTYTLVVSVLGYEPFTQEIRLSDSNAATYTIALSPRVYESDGIVVSAEETSARERRRQENNFEKFRKYFLGVSPYARHCTILNPDVLTFEHDRKEGFFQASANDALLIENQALGYQIRFVLEKFEVREGRNSTRIRYGGQTGFTELIPENEKQARQWSKSRERTYRGSQRHFLAALVGDRLWEEGYMLVEEETGGADYSGVPGSRPAERVKGVEPDDILYPGELPFEWTLDFPGYLKVINMREYPEKQYFQFKDYVAGWKLNDDEDQQTSWLALTQGPVTITADGRIYESYGLTKLGYWYFERVAEFLPAEYTPNGSSLFNPVAKDEPAVFSVLSADALITETFEQEAELSEERLERVTMAYLNLLEAADNPAPESEKRVIHKHVAQMEFLLPDSIKNNVLSKPFQHQATFVPIEPGAGATMATWWRSQDPFPATPANERVIEHLRRVGTATSQFVDVNATAGFDDRGKVFIQYGSPRTRTVIKTDLTESRKLLQQFAVPLPGPMIVPSNEFWAYGNVDDRLRYVFLLTGGRYRISEIEDMIPDDLRTAANRSGKRQVARGNAPVNRTSEAYGRALVAAYRTIYADLAIFHPAYEEQVQQLDSYDSDMRATGGVDVNATNTNPLLTGGGGLNSASYIQGIASKFSSDALQARVERDEQAPRSASQVADWYLPLPVAVRSSRFLDADKKTRMELDWSHIPGTFALSRRERKQIGLPDSLFADRYLVHFTVVDQQANYERHAESRLSYLASDLEKGAAAPIQSYDLELEETVKHLSLQWTQHRYVGGEGTGDVEEREVLKVGVQHMRDVDPLSVEPGLLEMSDLKPVYLGDDLAFFALRDNDEDTRPPAYPFTTITSETPLGLYFEVYELFYGAGDQARFTVEYEVSNDARRRRDRKTTSATTSYTVESRTAREFIAIDLSEYNNEGPILIRLKVTDETSGQQVERDVSFTLVE